MAKYFFDTEFNPTPFVGYPSLISIAIVSDDGREFYAISKDFDTEAAARNQWLMANVLPKLDRDRAELWMHREQMAEAISDFVGDDTKPEFWAYFADFDWVLFCEIFGGMLEMSDQHKRWPMYCRDLKQVMDMTDFPSVLKPDDPEDEHNALADARWNVLLFQAVAPGARRLGCYV